MSPQDIYRVFAMLWLLEGERCWVICQHSTVLEFHLIYKYYFFLDRNMRELWLRGFD